MGQYYGASVFGGPNDPGTGSTGYKGDNLNNLPNSFAELGMGTAMGNLPYGTQVRVTNPANGKSLVVTKRDIGKGGGAVGGTPRGIDLWYKAAQQLGVNGLAKVKVDVLGKGGGQTTQGINPAQPQVPTHAGVNRTQLQGILSQSLQRGYAPSGTELATAIISDATAPQQQQQAQPTLQGGGGSNGAVAQITQRANQVNAAHPAYLWGGGHGAKPAPL